MWYLAEQYQPGADAAAALTDDGVNVRFTGVSFGRADESCFCRFESDSIDAVRTTCQRAQFRTDRILPIDEIDAPGRGLPS